jgi:hypothetical protein
VTCLKTNWRLSFCAIVVLVLVPEAPAQADNGWQAHLAHYLFDSLRRPPQHDRPVSRPSPAPVLSRDGSQSSRKGVSGEQRCLRRGSLTRGARPLCLRCGLLAFLYCSSALRLFVGASVLKRGRISEMQEALPKRICYLRVCGPLSYRHQKEARCLPV